MKENQVLAIIQARMSSKRLPGKMMKKILGKPLIYYVVERLKESKKIDSVIVAISDNKSDDILEEFCINNSINYFRGPEEDVLKRVYDCAKKYKGNTIIRVCGDSPLIDPDIIDTLLKQFKDCEYLTNAIKPFVPKGTDLEILTFDVLKKIDFEAKKKEDREHVTKYICDNKNKFKIKEIYPDKSLYRPDIKLTVDTINDFILVEKIFKELYHKKKIFTTKDIINLLEKRPQIYLKKLKTEKVSIIIRVDGCRKFGLGHFNRCLNLAKELKKIKEFQIVFATKKYDDFDNPLKLLKKDEWFLIEKDANTTEEIKILKNRKPDIIITDLDYRSINDQYYKELTENFTVITIDDMGSNKIDAKAIINESIVESRQKYNTSKKTLLFAGPQYMMLGKNFGIFNKKKKQINKTIQNVLISLGGSDPKNNLRKIINALNKNNNNNITFAIILGKSYKNAEKVKSACADYKILQGVKNMYELMFDSDLIICNGGVTLYEANALGIPSAVIPQNVEEEGTGRRFNEHGSCMLLDKLSTNQIKSILEISQSNRIRMSNIGKSLVDGDGLSRVRDIITFCIINEMDLKENSY